MTPETVDLESADPGLVWPIKASFVAYVLGMEDGELAAADGATVSATQVFTFEPATASASPTASPAFDAATQRGTLAFRGDVRFVGHFGMLNVRIADPAIEFGPESIVLTAATGENGERIPLAILALPAPAVSDTLIAWHGVIPQLTTPGSDLFNGVYPRGQELDPLDIEISR